MRQKQQETFVVQKVKAQSSNQMVLKISLE